VLAPKHQKKSIQVVERKHLSRQDREVDDFFPFDKHHTQHLYLIQAKKEVCGS
jgi:hypothetical protein